jgi:hypothetical protein
MLSLAVSCIPIIAGIVQLMTGFMKLPWVKQQQEGGFAEPGAWVDTENFGNLRASSLARHSATSENIAAIFDNDNVLKLIKLKAYLTAGNRY